MESKDSGMEILNVGCGKNKIPGSIGIDIEKNSLADVIHDLTAFPYPFENNRFTKIYCKQVLEHFDRPLDVLRELHRVAKPGAIIRIEVPHFSSYNAFRSLHHRRFFSYFTFDTFLKTSDLFELTYRSVSFHRVHRRWGLQYIFNKFPETYERFWTFICPAENMYFELKVKK